MYVFSLSGFDLFFVYFSMVVTQGSGSGDPERQSTSDDKIHRIICTEVVAVVREAIPEVFRSIKTAVIKMFDERCDAITESVVVAAAATASIATIRPHGGDVMQYQDFNNTKHP